MHKYNIGIIGEGLLLNFETSFFFDDFFFLLFFANDIFLMDYLGNKL